jgi:ADP-heptose:LPS heptosyltransferase
LTKVAVVKPDHLGDLILSSPAIRAAERHFGAITLFVSDTTRALARFLFPNCELRPINFPHLARQPVPPLDVAGIAAELSAFDLVLWLRDDPPVRALAQSVRAQHDFGDGGYLTHQSALDQRMMTRHVGDYSRTTHFGPKPICWPSSVKSVGLCVAAGFPTNRWPNLYWLELGTALGRAGFALTLIGGPGEKRDVALLARCLAQARVRTLIGGSDLQAFLDGLDDIDVVVASDGGTAHLCSLRKPMLSIFGSSPWRRYAPFGRDNIVITRNLSCSPCLQFNTQAVNGCVTRECLVGLTSGHVMAALESSGADAGTGAGMILQRGTSHAFSA